MAQSSAAEKLDSVEEEKLPTLEAQPEVEIEVSEAPELLGIHGELAQKEADLLYAEQMEAFFKNSGESGENLHPFEEHREELQKEVTTLQRSEEVVKLQSEIQELNDVVKKNEATERFGKQFGFNKDEVYAYIENKIQEDETLIRSLERPPEPRREEAPKGETAKKELPKESTAETEEAQVVNQIDVLTAPRVPMIRPNGEIVDLLPGDVVSEREGEESLPSEAVQELRFAYAGTRERLQKKKRRWGWIKERLKGLLTFGFWEMRQAERFRRTKKQAAQDLEQLSGSIQKTEYLNMDQALEEAFAMKVALTAEGVGEATREDYERISQAITAEKQKANEGYIKNIIEDKKKEITERLKKYRNEHGEIVVDNPEKMKDFEKTLYQELKVLQDGRINADAKEFDQLIKKSLDPKYWRRYVYGGVELALDAGALSLVVTKIAAYKASMAARKAYQAGKGSMNLTNTMSGHELSGAEFTDEYMNMKDTVWGASREWLKCHGILHPTNTQILETAKAVCTDNGIGVKEWGIAGQPFDRLMQAGHVLKFSGALKKLFFLKSLAALGGVAI